MTVRTVREEAELKAWALVKHEVVEDSLLPEIGHESDISDRSAISPINSANEKVVAGCLAFRTHVNEFLSTDEAAT